MNVFCKNSSNSSSILCIFLASVTLIYTSYYHNLFRYNIKKISPLACSISSTFNFMASSKLLFSARAQISTAADRIKFFLVWNLFHNSDNLCYPSPYPFVPHSWIKLVALTPCAFCSCSNLINTIPALEGEVSSRCY